MASFNVQNSAARWTRALRVDARVVGAPAAADGTRVVWLARERRTALSDARWARQAAGIEVCVVRTIRDALTVCSNETPLACVVEFELAEQDGVSALLALRRAGVVAPVVLLTTSPELALGAVQRSPLGEAVPVFARTERFERLREWFEQLHTCCLVSGL